VFQTIGFRVAEVQQASVFKAFQLRFPWLLATVASGTVCAFLAGAYEATLAQSIVLAFFLTLVLGLGESVSAQSLTVSVQALHSVQPDLAWIWRALRKEFPTALMLGCACGLLVGVIVWLWRGAPVAALVVGGSIVLAMLTASLVGLLIPALLHRFKWDPKIASGPLVLALADVCTLLYYFNIARAAF
jgi:magnesium transporter